MTCLAGVVYTIRQRYREYLADRKAYGFVGAKGFRQWYNDNHRSW